MELTREQINMLETMNTHIDTLKDRLPQLLATCRISLREPEEDELEAVSDTKTASAETMNYKHTHTDNKEKAFEADIHTNNMVYAVESLLGLISHLRKMYIVRATHRDTATHMKGMARAYEQQSKKISAELEIISEEVAEGLKELESELSETASGRLSR
ncbi:hypothetical protein AAMO2058_000891500 [Amorphochlora amoebiformis]